MKLKIAHLSDPHFGTIKPEVFLALGECLRGLAPELIIVTGDITQRARRGQFKEASDFFKSLEPIPQVVLPGNHDIALYNFFSRLLSPYRLFKKYFGPPGNQRILLPGVEVFALNSTSRFRIIQGKLGAGLLRKTLANGNSKMPLRVVAFHHPLACPKRVDTKNLLIDRRDVMKVLEEHKVDVVLSGHIHDPLIGLSQENYPDVQRAVVISVAGTCLSWRTRADAPNSFHWLELDVESALGPHLRISRYDLQKDGKFRSVSQEEFSRQKDSGWQRANFPTKETFDPGEEFLE